ncbi:MAG: hypothetical protein H6537_04715 [Bacteroidales bacterium]|nr:hypothetical protein [Bacteroidales bacterium]
MKNKTLIVLLFAAAALITCKREALPKVDANGKVELTVTADTVSYVFASFGCSLSEKANFAVERYGFCWDTLPGVTVAKQCCAFSNLFGTTFQKDVNGLKPNTKYYLKAYLEAGDATIYSKEVVLQTANAKPIVTTAEVNSVKANRAACRAMP